MILGLKCTTRADALNGIILRNLNGKGFEALDFENKFFVPGDAKSP